MSTKVRVTRDELNELIAATFEGKPSELPITAAMVDHDYSPLKFWQLASRPWRWTPRFDYTTDIAAAWQLFLHERVHYYSVRNMKDGVRGTYVEIGWLRSPVASATNPFSVSLPRMDNVPLAICLAYLQSVTGTHYELDTQDRETETTL